MSPMKPVRLPAAATVALPRWGIFALCLLYIVPGLVGRAPWKGDDAAGFGIMWTMAQGGWADWLWPHIVGLPMPEEGPLSFWLGALCIKLFGSSVGAPAAAHISTALAFALGAGAVWYSTYLLGRRAEAQPLKLPFGGQPDARDFGRTLADGALLIYLGCLGLLVRSHEASAESLQIGLIALLIYFCCRLFEQTDAQPKRSALKLGLVLGLLILCRGWVLPLGLFLTLNGLSLYLKQAQRLAYLWLLSLPVMAGICASWLLIISLSHPYDSSPYAGWMLWNYRQILNPSLDNLAYLFRNGIWFTWPAWPFAAWAIYAWRRQERALHIALPLSFIVCFMILACLNRYTEESILLPLIPAIAILAAFGLPTMKRSTINAIDWFAITVLSGVAIFIWLGWLAQMTGWPVQLAHKARELAPDFQAEFSWLSFSFALIISLIWLRLVAWRVARRPAVLWRAVVLSSGGLILCWSLLLSLWLPWIDARISYEKTALELRTHLPLDYRCVQANIGPSQRASFAYFGLIHFAGFSDHDCQLFLTQSSRRKAQAADLPAEFRAEDWQIIWQGHRSADKDELFTLYQRK